MPRFVGSKMSCHGNVSRQKWHILMYRDTKWHSYPGQNVTSGQFRCTLYSLTQIQQQILGQLQAIRFQESHSQVDWLE